MGFLPPDLPTFSLLILKPLNVLITPAAWTFLQLSLSDVASIVLSITAIRTRDLRNLFLMKSKEEVFYSCIFSQK